MTLENCSKEIQSRYKEIYDRINKYIVDFANATNSLCHLNEWHFDEDGNIEIITSESCMGETETSYATIEPKYLENDEAFVSWLNIKNHVRIESEKKSEEEHKKFVKDFKYKQYLLLKTEFEK